MKSLEQWMNDQRRANPARFWLGWMLPLNLFIVYATLMFIVWAVKSGWLQ
jgi:hypothetical protein